MASRILKVLWFPVFFLILQFPHNLYGYFNTTDSIIIVIDPGHGGKDPGCAGKKSREKEIVLDIALLLEKKLKESHHPLKVLLTRRKDKFIALADRANLANQHNAELFVSLHCNSASIGSVYGSETYVLGLHRAEDNLEVAKRENSAILHESDYRERYEGYDPNSPLVHIMANMYQNQYLEQSLLLSSHIQKHLTLLKRKNRGVKQAGFLVLRETVMPAVLVECGFLTHRQEEEYLFSRSGQEQIAKALSDAIIKYLDVYYKEDKDESKYFLQLAALSKPADPESDLWKDVPLYLCVKEHNIYKCYSGPYSTVTAARKQMLMLKENGFSDIFIVRK